MRRPVSPNEDEETGLIAAVCHETATPGQVRRLEALVLADPAVEARLIQALALYGGIVSHYSSGPAMPVGGIPRAAVGPAGGRRPSKFRARYLLAVAAAGLVAFAVTRPDRAGRDGPGQELEAVATLSRSVEAVWEGGTQSVRIGAQLAPGPLTLKSGLAQIEFFSGATVVLEGPAEFRVVSSMEAFCGRGKLRAHVPPQANGFLVRTPRLDLVDRGTEFALQVRAEAGVDIHVFQGKVELYEPGSAAGRELRAGQGERWGGPDAPPTPIPANPAGFTSAQEMSVRFEADMSRRYAKWKAAGQALKADPALLAYYPFDGEKGRERTLIDRRPGDAGRNGAIVGAVWAEGRWPGKKWGLEFREGGDRVRFHVPGVYTSLTLAAWVNVDRLDWAYNSLMLTDRWLVGAVHWQILADGVVVLGVHGAESGGWTNDKSNYSTPPLLGPNRLGRWVHLAVVYDGRPGGRVSHYVDGKRASADSLRFATPLHVGNAELGNWAIDSTGDSPSGRSFKGRMDEFMMFSRPLTGAEIAKIFQDGMPGY